MVGTSSEDTLLFVGLTPKVVKFKRIYKILEEFAEQKQMIDPSDRFNLIFFQKEGPVYLDNFTFDFESLLDTYKEYEKKIVRANVAGGIFLASTFTIDVYKKISDKIFRLIVLVDKGSLKIPEHYLPVILNLLDKIKDMPFIIDILKLGKDDPDESLKYMKIAKKCGGEVYEILSPKHLMEVMVKLAEKKTIDTDYFASKEATKLFSEENRMFYENLADNAKVLASVDTCSVCFKKDDRVVVKCPNCDTIAHMECWARWAKTSNIGVPHLFRCHNCFNLLAMDENFVEIVQEGKEVEELEIEKTDLMTYLRSLEEKHKPQVVQAEDPLALSPEDMDDLEEIPELVQETDKSGKSGEDLFSALSSRSKKGSSKIIVCPSCSAIAGPNDKTCPNCGYRL